MNKLPSSISEAIKAIDGDELQFVDPETQRVYFLIDSETHRRARAAMQQQEDWEAIQEGVVQAKRGESVSADEFRKQIRDDYGFDV